MSDQKNTPPLKDMSTGYMIGLNFIVSILMATGIGYVIDQWLESLPWGMLVGAFLGFCAGLRTLWQALNKKDDKSIE